MTAACKGQPLSVFFDFDNEQAPYSEALAHARSFCDTCPMRVDCLADCMKAEGNDGVEYRDGIFAGFTPQQRHSLHKRGVDFSGLDPVDLRKGVNGMKPLPDRGDLWTERHTKLARMVIGWIVHNVPVGGDMPDAMALSRQLKVGVKDLRRVYQALREDTVLKRTDTGNLIYFSEEDSWNWLPKHLRVDTHRKV